MFGHKWNNSNIAKMLRSPVYSGVLAYNKQISGSLFSMDAKGKIRGKRGNFKNERDTIATRVDHPLANRQLVEAFVQRVEVHPETKTATF